MKIRLGERYDFTPLAFEGEQCGRLPQQSQKAAKDTGHALSAIAAEANRRHMTYGQLVASERVAI